MRQRSSRWLDGFYTFLEKHTGLVVWFFFGTSVLSKGLLIPFLGAASFPNSDEHIFIEIAKNFFYNHNFYSNGFSSYMQYNEVLLPLALSPSYFFFSPEHILTILRSYGLVLISLAIFPAYQLGFLILESKKQALLVALIAVLLPEITLAYTVSQEVIYYPLYLVALVQIYRRIRGQKVSSLLMVGLFLLLWLCKAVGITVLVAYASYLVFEFVYINKFKNPKTFIIELVIVVVGVIGMKELITLGIRFLNTGSLAGGSDFYARALSSSLKAAPDKLLNDISNGTLYYLFYTLLAFIVFPLILPLDNLKQYLQHDRKYLAFLGICFMGTIGTVVYLVYMAEGGANKDLPRIHLRYFFPLVIPFVTLLFKLDFSRMKLGIPGILSALFLLLYQLLIRPRFKSGSIIDAKSLMLLEWINSEVVNGFNLIFLVAVLLCVYLGYLLYKKLDGLKVRRIIILGMLAVLLANQTYATYDTFRYYRERTSGLERRAQYSLIGHLVDSRPGSPMIFYSFPTLWFDVLLSTQTNRDFSRANYLANVLEYPFPAYYPPNFIITPKDLLKHAQIRHASRVQLDSALFDVYQVESTQDQKIDLEYNLTKVFPDGWLEQDAKLYVNGAGRDDQVNVELGLFTSPLAGPIEALISDTTGRVTQVKVNPEGTSLHLLVSKNPGEKNFEITLGAQTFFIPKDKPDVFGANDDARKLTYRVNQINIQ